MYRILILFLFALSVQAQDGSPSERYGEALSTFQARLYTNAEADFRALLADPALPASLRDNCWYWIGECRYAEGAWLDALAEFSRVAGWPGSNKREAAQLKIILCWQNMDEKAEACRQAEKLQKLWPGGEYIDQADRLVRLNCN